MNLFEITLLNSMLVIYPLICFLLYLVFQKTLSKRKNDLFLDLALFSNIYLIIKFGITDYNKIPFIIIDIPLIIAYFSNRKLSIIILSIIITFYYYNKFDINLLIIVIEYLIYYILYLIFKQKKKKTDLFSTIYMILKVLNVYNYIYLSSKYSLDTNEKLIWFLILMTLFFIITKLILALIYNSNSVLSLYNSIQNIEEEKRIKQSLFKITHEIKNPIAVVKGYLDMFDYKNKDHFNYIPIIKDEIERVLVLLEDFLSITKIKIDKDIMDLSMLIEDIENSFSLILKEKNIKLITYFEEELYIYADYNRLKQVLVNIIKNSMEAIIKNGNIFLTVKNKKNEIKIIIKDDGPGISDDNLKTLKEAFFTTKKDGTGLGIYLSNEIIKEHKGSLLYESNNGLQVTITIPINKKDIKIIS